MHLQYIDHSTIYIAVQYLGVEFGSEVWLQAHEVLSSLHACVDGGASSSSLGTVRESISWLQPSEGREQTVEQLVRTIQNIYIE